MNPTLDARLAFPTNLIIHYLASSQSPCHPFLDLVHPSGGALPGGRLHTDGERLELRATRCLLPAAPVSLLYFRFQLVQLESKALGLAGLPPRLPRLRR